MQYQYFNWLLNHCLSQFYHHSSNRYFIVDNNSDYWYCSVIVNHLAILFKPCIISHFHVYGDNNYSRVLVGNMCQLTVGFSQAAPERWLGHIVWHHFSSESPLLLLSLIHYHVWITNGIDETITNSCERFCNERDWLRISFPSTFHILLWSNGVIAFHSTGLANPNSSSDRAR